LENTWWSAGTRLAIWTALVAALSLLPFRMKHALGTHGPWHDAGHLGAFAITAWLFLAWHGPPRTALWRLWPVIAFALVLEWLEAAPFGNPFEWGDVRVDSLGTLAAWLAYWLYAKPAGRSSDT